MYCIKWIECVLRKSEYWKKIRYVLVLRSILFGDIELLGYLKMNFRNWFYNIVKKFSMDDEWKNNKFENVLLFLGRYVFKKLCFFWLFVSLFFFFLIIKCGEIIFSYKSKKIVCKINIFLLWNDLKISCCVCFYKNFKNKNKKY